MKLRLVIMVVALSLFFGALFGYDHYKTLRANANFANFKPPPVPVVVASANLQEVPQALRAVGSLEAVRQLELSPELAGRITAIHFQPGDTVSAGQPLLQLNDAPEKGELQRLRAQARVAALNLERNKKVVGLAVSQSDLDVQQANREAIEGEIVALKARIDQKLVRAPFAGQLGVSQVNLGEYLTPGDTITTLTDLHALYLNLSLPEQARTLISVGQTVRFRVDAYPGREFNGQIIAIDPQIGVDTRGIALQASVANINGELAPGMFADAHVELPPKKDVLVVPETAITYTIHGDSVFALQREGNDLRVYRQLVTVGDRFNGNVSILGGLRAGTQVAIAGQVNLQDGTPVEIVDGSTLVQAIQSTEQLRQ